MPTSVAIAVASSFAAETLAAEFVTHELIAALPAWIGYSQIESAIGFSSAADMRAAISSGRERGRR